MQAGKFQFDLDLNYGMVKQLYCELCLFELKRHLFISNFFPEAHAAMMVVYITLGDNVFIIPLHNLV